MNDITTPTSGSIGTQVRTDVASIMDTALAPFILYERWHRSFSVAREAEKFVDVDQYGDLVALGDDVDWMAARARAVEIQNKLPPPAEIAAAHKAVGQAIRVKPASGEYQLLASKMLDVLGIRGGDDTDAYIEGLAWMLADAWSGESDRCDTPNWIPIPAFAKTIKMTWQDRDSWNHYGGTKRPPIPDIVERCKDYRRELVYLHENVEMLHHTQKRLGQIIKTVNSYEADEDGWFDE